MRSRLGGRLVVTDKAVRFDGGPAGVCYVPAERIRTYWLRRSAAERLLGACTLLLYGPGAAESASKGRFNFAMANELLVVRGLTDVDGVRTAMEALLHVCRAEAP